MSDSSSSSPSEIDTLRRELATMRQSLIDEGTLDGAFEEVENSNKSGFLLHVEDTLTVYFEDAARMISIIGHAMTIKPKEYAEFDKALKTLRDHSSKVGAKKVRNAVTTTRECVRHENIEGAKEALKNVKTELASVITKLEPYFEKLRKVALIATS
ncbi:hypothetical protein ACFE04_018970 [Oxalis oulophora]